MQPTLAVIGLLAVGGLLAACYTTRGGSGPGWAGKAGGASHQRTTPEETASSAKSTSSRENRSSQKKSSREKPSQKTGAAEDAAPAETAPVEEGASRKASAKEEASAREKVSSEKTVPARETASVKKKTPARETTPAQKTAPAETPFDAKARLALPTENKALFDEGGSAFYQHTNRTFEGRRSYPWQGGMYGFHRNPVRTDQGIVYTRFHEGLDIRAVRRDGRGEPLDPVRAIDDGRVAYVNARASRSNYGKYIVVEHDWGGALYYSLYAHLEHTSVQAGQEVRQGDQLGRIGYTGHGLNRKRAHLHFELNLMVNRDFQQWFDKHLSWATNRHGIFNGLNMRGLNVSALYRALHRDPNLRIAAFIQRQPAYFKVTVPNDGPLDLAVRYPWLTPEGADTKGAVAWEISFTRGGFPLSIRPAAPVERPRVTADPPGPGNCRYLTGDTLKGTVPGCVLTRQGRRYMDLLTIGETGPAAHHRGE